MEDEKQNTETPTKRPIGRPTDYRPEFCERVVELGKEGKSYTQIASALDISKQCLYEWIHLHQEFGDAMTRARQESQTWWENVGQVALFAEKFQPTVYNKAMQCRFPEDYLEKTQVNSQTLDKNGKPTDPAAVTAAEIYERNMAAILKAKKADDE